MALSDLLAITNQIDEEKEKDSASTGGGGSTSASSTAVVEEPEEEEEQFSRPKLTDIAPVVTESTEEPAQQAPLPNVEKPAKKGSVQRPHQSLYPSESPADKLRKEKWYDGETPTEVDIVARIFNIAQVDKSYADSIYGDYIKLKDAGQFKETYGSATSDWLGTLGIDDPSELNDEIIAGFMDYVRENGTTTASGALSSAKKYGKKSVLAYNLNELIKDYGTTKELLAEQDEVAKEVAYWIAQGLTDEEIKKKVDLSSYSGLNAALERARGGQYTPTTSAVPLLTSYGMDGLLYAMRNPDSSKGDFFLDAVQGKLGRGVKSTSAPEQIARRTPGDPAWAPYATSGTMHDEAIKFGVTGFDRKWLDDNYARIANSGDQDLINAYGRVAEGVERTEKAQQEAAALRKTVDSMIASGMSPDRIFTDDLLEEYPTLKDMYEGQQKLKLVDTTSPVDFDLYSLRNEAEKAYKDAEGTVPGKDYAQRLETNLGASTPSYEGDAELDKAEEENLTLVQEIMYFTSTPHEQDAAKSSKPNYYRVMASAASGVSAGTGGTKEAYNSAITAANDYAGAHYLTAVGAFAEAQQHLNDLKDAAKPMDDFLEKWFPEQDKGKVAEGLVNGDIATPDDPEFQKEYGEMKRHLGDYQTYLTNLTEAEGAVANEQRIIDNIAAQYEAAEELNTTGAPSQSAMPMLNYISQYTNYNAKKEYASFGDWQYDVEIHDVPWSEANELLGKRKENNQKDLEYLDTAIEYAENHHADEQTLANMRRTRDVIEADNRSIDYAQLQNADGFNEAVAKFDAEEKTGLLSFGHDNVIHDGMVNYNKWQEQKLMAEGDVPEQVNESQVFLMTDNERDTYKYLYVTQGKEAATEYVDFLGEYYLGNRKAAYVQMETERLTEEHPIAMNAITIAGSPLQALGAVEVVRAVLTGDEIDPNSEFFRMGQVVGEVRDTSTEMIVEHFGEGTTAAKVATFAYQTGTSIGDSLAAAPMGGAVTMGLESFANTAMEATLNGGDKWDVILLAGITGLAEVGTEYIPMKGLEDAFKAGGKTGLKNHLADLMKSAASGLTEAPGEALSELISGAADTIIMDELSAYSQNVAQYMQSGMTEEEANRKATQDFWKNVGMAGLQGLASGGVQNTVAYVAGSALKGKPQQARPVMEDETATPVVEEAPAPTEESAVVQEEAPAVEPGGGLLAEAMTEKNAAPEITPEPDKAKNTRMVAALATAQQDGISLSDRTATVNGVLEAGGLEPGLALAYAKEIAKDIPGLQQLQQSIQKMTTGDTATALKAAAYRMFAPPANADTMSDADVVSAVESDPKLSGAVENAVLNSDIATETMNVLKGMDKKAVENARKAQQNARRAMIEAATSASAKSAAAGNAFRALQSANEARKQNPTDTKVLNRAMEAAKQMRQAKAEADEARRRQEAAKQSFDETNKALLKEKMRATNEARRIAKETVMQRRAEQMAAAQQQKAAETMKTGFANADEVNQYVDYAFEYAENPSLEKQTAFIDYAEADERLIEDVADYVDLTGFVHSLRDNDIRHIRNSHGEKTNEKYPVTREDIKRIPDIVENYDDVIYLRRAGKEGIYYVQRHNGVTYYLEAIIRDGEGETKRLQNKQMIKVPTGTIPAIKGLRAAIEKKWGPLPAAGDATDTVVPSMYVQDVQELPTSDIVPDSATSVNASALDISSAPTVTMNPQSPAPVAPSAPATTPNIPAPPPGMGVSQFAGQTGQNTNVLSDKVKADLAASPFYKKTTEKENLGKAISNIERDGYDVRKNKLLDGSTNLYTPDGQVEAYVLAKIAKENGDTAGESAIAFRVKESGTLLGQSLAMRRMYVEMTPAGKAQYVQRIVDQYNAEYERLRKDTRIDVPAWLAERLEKASGDEAATEQVLHEAYSAIAEQMPPDWRTRINGYRYLAMLGNSRTHIRNVVGNALFMPAVAVKNKVGAALETTFNASERTKTLGSVKKEYRDFANSQLEDVRDILTGGGKHSPQSEIQQQRRTFNNAKLEWLSKKNSELLEREDAVFLNRHFSNALAGYLQANNVDLANVDDATLQAGLTYAIKEAKKATYRDDSELADKISRFSRDLNTSEKFGSRVAGTVLEGALPFKKTPINVMRRGVEYSPIGLMKALTVDSFKLKNGSITTSEYFDNLASGITGTALAALGFWAYGLGHVKLSLDDKEGELDKLDGSQEYSIEFSLFGNDISYTLDWMSPSAMPFFVGAAIGELTQSDEEVNLRTLYDALQGITEPVFNLSMMEGVNKLLSSASWSENGFIGVIGNALESYATQFVPSTLGAFARTFDKTRRTTYTDKNSGTPSGLQYLWDSTINKIPGLSFTGQPYLNAWGEEDITENVIVRAIENFLSPGYLNTLSTDDVEQGLMELFDRTGEPGLVPKAPSKYFTVAEERKELTGPEYEQLTKERGQLAKRLHEELFASPEFMAFDDEYKVYALAQVWNYATKTAQHHIDDRVKLTGWMMSTDNPAQSIISETNDKIISDKKDEYRSGIYDAVDSGDYENATTCIQGLKEMGVKKGDIKKSVTTHYKEQYKALYRDGDIEGMYEMRDMLVNLGLGYTYPEFDKWLK